MFSDELPFLCALSNRLRRSSFVPCSGSTSWRFRVLGWSAWTLWRGPRTRPFTFSWLILSSFASMPGQKTERTKRTKCCWVRVSGVKRSKTSWRDSRRGESSQYLLNIRGCEQLPPHILQAMSVSTTGHSSRHTNKSCGPAGFRVTWLVSCMVSCALQSCNELQLPNRQVMT